MCSSPSTATPPSALSDPPGPRPHNYFGFGGGDGRGGEVERRGGENMGKMTERQRERERG